MGAEYRADPPGGCRARVHRGLHGGYIPLKTDHHQAAAHIVPAQQADLRGFQPGICRFQR